MSANINDHFNKASNMNGSYPAVATVSSARSTGGSTLSCDDLSSWATDTPVHFSTFKVAADGTIDTSSQTDWKGIVVGNTITEMARLAGAADSGNASGDKVELNPTIGWLDDLITGILRIHNQDGTLKDKSVAGTKLADATVGTDKLTNDAVWAHNIKDAAVTASKIDFTTFSEIYDNEVTTVGKTYTISTPGIYLAWGISANPSNGSIPAVTIKMANAVKAKSVNVSNGVWATATAIAVGLLNSGDTIVVSQENANAADYRSSLGMCLIQRTQ